MILKLINQSVLANYAAAHRALLEEVAREAAEQARGSHPAAGAEELLDAKDLAVKLSVPVSWVYEQSRQGNIPTHRIGRYVRFRLSEVLERPQQQLDSSSTTVAIPLRRSAGRSRQAA